MEGLTVRIAVNARCRDGAGFGKPADQRLDRIFRRA